MSSETPARPDAPKPEPIILTLAMEDRAWERFQTLRQRHFPQTLNRVPAHVTLFHALPDDEAKVRAVVEKACAERAPFDVEVTELRSLGRGVAYRCHSDELSVVRDEIASTFSDRLTKQDAQGFRAHVTVQNKVTPETAKQTLEALSRDFEPWSFRALGIDIWHYAGGPWRPIGRVEFCA